MYKNANGNKSKIIKTKIEAPVKLNVRLRNEFKASYDDVTSCDNVVRI